MTRTLVHVAMVAGSLMAVLPAWAQGEPTPAPLGFHRAVRGQAGASINNPGLQNVLEVAWTRPISESTHPLLGGAHIAAGVTQLLTPTQARLGGWFEYSPLSILDVRAGADPSFYFGTFDSLMGFSSYDEAFDPDSRKARGGAEPGLAGRVYVAPTLKFKAGPIVGSSTAEFEWWRSNVSAPFFYEPVRDTLLESDGDRLITTTSVLMHQWGAASSTFSIGALHTFSQVREASFNRIQKIGVIAIKQFGTAHLGLPNPRVTVVMGRYLDDPSKQGEWTAGFAIGFRP